REGLKSLHVDCYLHQVGRHSTTKYPDGCRPAASTSSRPSPRGLGTRRPCGAASHEHHLDRQASRRFVGPHAAEDHNATGGARRPGTAAGLVKAAEPGEGVAPQGLTTSFSMRKYPYDEFSCLRRQIP